MPNRFTTAGRRLAYASLVNRDGERCQKCGRKPPKTNLEIDHKDHDPTNHSLTNLRLLCKSCNVADSNNFRRHTLQIRKGPNEPPKTPPRRHGLYPESTSLNGSENKRTGPMSPENTPPATWPLSRTTGLNASQNGCPSALCVCVKPHEQNGTDGAVLKEALGYQDGSPEMRANSWYEPEWVRWMDAHLMDHPHISARTAINAGALAVGCSPATAKRYLDKYTDFNGPFELVRDGLGVKLVVRRES